MKFDNTLNKLVQQIIKTGGIPALMGEPGIGKSSFMEDLAYQMGTKSFTVQCNLLADKADLTGGRLMKDDANGEYRMSFFPHEDIMEAIEYAEANPREWPILFLDEINRTTSDVTSAALGLSTARKIGRKHLPDNLRIAVAGNDKGNVTSLDEASLSRFVIIHVEPDAGTFISISGDELNSWIREVLTAHPTLIFQKSTPNAIVADGSDGSDGSDANVTMADLFDGGEEMNQLTTPRTVSYLSRWLNKVDRLELGEYLAAPVTIEGRETSQLNEIVESFTGDTMFTTQLVATIAQNLASNSGGQVQSTINVSKPNCYADLKKAQNVTDLEQLISTLTSNELSGSLVYALKESENNSRLIEQLALVTNQIEPEHTRTLIDLVRTQQIDRQNLEAFLEVDAPVVDAARPFLSAFL